MPKSPWICHWSGFSKWHKGVEEARKSPVVDGEWKILLGWIFLSGGGHLRRSAFDHLNLYQSKKQYSVNTEHQLKLN